MNKVDRIIDLLNDRAGFDDWWHDLDEKIQNDIRVEIENVINEPVNTYMP